MRFRSTKELVDRARDEGYAVPAFNSNGGTYDIARAAIEAAEEMRSPLILQTYEPNVAYRGFEYCGIQAARLAQGTTVPIALHLDHGMSLDSVMAAVRAGYSGVMIDGSHLPLEENIALTKKVIETVKPLGIAVEAEIGHVAGGVHSRPPNPSPTLPATGRELPPGGADVPPPRCGEGWGGVRGQSRAGCTEPAEAVYFVEQTGVDMLAVANGTLHGIFDLQDDIDLDLVRELKAKVPVPLVQHGTCGIPDNLLSKLAAAGMAKINFGEGFRANYIIYFKELADTLDHQGHPWKIMQAVKDLLKEDMKALIRALRSEGKAR